MNFGQNIYNWFISQIGPLYLVGVIGTLLYTLIQRKVTKLLGFLVIALLVGGVVFAPDILKSLAPEFAKRILGG